MTETVTNPELAGCSIALKCANDPQIERCLDSIDDDVDVHVVITPNDTIEGILRDRGVGFSVTDFGNIAKSCEIGVNEAENDNIIIMDSDAWFVPGSIRKLRLALRDNTLAKPRLEFLSAGRISDVVARHRLPFNNQPGYATNPGLAFRRQEVREACGGYVFNDKIRWTEDADLNYRAELAGLETVLVPEACVRHGAISLHHELKTAWLYGVGKRLSIEHTPGREPYEEFPDIAVAALKALRPDRVAKNIYSQGLAVAALDATWQSIYIAGYHAQKRTGRWTVDEP